MYNMIWFWWIILKRNVLCHTKHLILLHKVGPT